MRQNLLDAYLKRKKQMHFFFKIKDKTFQIKKLSSIIRQNKFISRYSQVKLQKVKDEQVIKPTEGFTGKIAYRKFVF